MMPLIVKKVYDARILMDIIIQLKPSIEEKKGLIVSNFLLFLYDFINLIF